MHGNKSCIYSSGATNPSDIYFHSSGNSGRIINYDESVEFCDGNNSTLPQPKTNTTYNQLKSYIDTNNLNSKACLFLGMTRLTVDTWQWNDGTDVDMTFVTSDISNDIRYKCTNMKIGTGTWSDYHCDSLCSVIICERKCVFFYTSFLSVFMPSFLICHIICMCTFRPSF